MMHPSTEEADTYSIFLEYFNLIFIHESDIERTDEKSIVALANKMKLQPHKKSLNENKFMLCEDDENHKIYF